MLPVRSQRRTPQRRPRQNGLRKAGQPARTGSILSTIRNIVAAPFSWFNHSDQLEDFSTKRRRSPAYHKGADEYDLDSDAQGSRSKKMRIDSPIKASGYLDPPEKVFPTTRQTAEPSRSGAPSYLDKHGFTNSIENVENTPPNELVSKPKPEQPTFSAPSQAQRPLPSFLERQRSPMKGSKTLQLPRNMSIDPLPRDKTLSREPTSLSIRGMSVDHAASSFATTVSTSLDGPPAPFKLRTSLTPQPSPTKPARREASAPPPLAVLMANPIFVKPPPDAKKARKLEDLKTVSLGTLAEFHRSTRSPSRDRTLNIFGPMDSRSSQPPGSYARMSVAEKTLQELDVYKTPIIPSRYRDSKTIPQFLKPKRAHVPIPMTRKGKPAKPSLGMAERMKSVEKGDGKPYAGRGNLSKMLAKRRAEEEEEKLGTNNDVQKRDVGVSAGFSTDSEDERKRVRKPLDVSPFTNEELISYGGRLKFGGGGGGKIGPTRTRRENVHSSVPLNRGRNKFSASFDDDDDGDDFRPTAEAETDAVAKAQDEAMKAATFQPPLDFSFAQNTAAIQHDLANAKEPPVTNLPFSFGTSELLHKPSEPAPSLTQASAAPLSTFAIPRTFAPSVTSEVSPAEEPVPAVSITPSTPDQAAAATQSAETNGIPNFFANSSFLANNSAASPTSISTTLTSTSPAVPVKDPENPFWENKSGLSNAPRTDVPSVDNRFEPIVERPKSTEPKPSPFGGFSRPSTFPSVDAPVPAPEPVQPSSPFVFKPAELPKEPAALAPQTVPTPVPAPTLAPPTFTFGQPVQPAAPTPSVEKPAFTFGAPVSFGSTAVSTVEAPKVPSFFGSTPTPSTTAGAPEAPKTAFTFGLPAAASQNATTSTIQAPKPVFGTAGTGFSFGNTITASTEPPRSPFAFGAAPSTPPDQKKNLPGSVPQANPTGFTFGAPMVSNVNGVGSSAPSPVPTPSTTPAFTFGAAVAPPRAVTPPRQEMEMRMDESPTRMDENGRGTTENKPSTSGFTFGLSNNSPAPLFGMDSSTTMPSSSTFTFGAPLQTNHFSSDASKNGGGFGGMVGRTASAPVLSSPGFSFGQKPIQITQSQSSGFGSQPFGQPAPSTTPAFAFGGNTSTTTNAFGQPSQPVGSTPSSPATFASPTPFAFGAPNPTTPVSNTGFSFGAGQPSSPAPASPANTNAPFMFGQGAAPPSGAPTFNIGSAPPAAPGQRQVKKLPRRGQVKR